MHYDGQQVKALSSGITVSLNALWGTGNGKIFVVGDYQTIIHFDGQKWQTQLATGLYRLNGVWGTDEKNVYAVGGGAILHYDGANWRPFLTGYPCELVGVGGWGKDKVVVALACGDALLAEATSGAKGPWVVLHANTQSAIRSLWTSSEGAVATFAGRGGAVLSLRPKAGE